MLQEGLEALTMKFKEREWEEESVGEKVSRDVSLSVLPLHGTEGQIVSSSPPPIMCWLLRPLWPFQKADFIPTL